MIALLQALLLVKIGGLYRPNSLSSVGYFNAQAPSGETVFTAVVSSEMGMTLLFLYPDPWHDYNQIATLSDKVISILEDLF
jgi:hypothetical protein